MRPVFHLLIATFLVGATFLGVAVAHAEDPDVLRAEASRLEGENAVLGETAQRALLELYALETRLGRASRRAEQLDARIQQLERRQQQSKTHLEIARNAEDTAQRQLDEQLTALYIQGETDPLEIILGASSLDEAITAVDNLSRLAEENDRIVARARETRRDLRSALIELGERERELRDAAAEANATRRALTAARDEKAGYVASLEGTQALNAAEIGELTSRASEAERRTSEVEAQLPAQTPAASTTTRAAVSTAADVSDRSLVAGRQLTVDAVAYSLPGSTASGLPVGKGVVAVDPTVIPLGTRMYVPGYGPAVAADVGTAIKGLIIDLWFPTYEQAVSWGRRTVTITIYE
jgi:peptidoglycan DL-endopeptidase CwlO